MGTILPRSARFKFDHPSIQWFGRRTLASGTAELHYGGTGCRFRFQGSSLALDCERVHETAGVSLGIRIDGSPEIPVLFFEKGRTLRQAVVGLEAGWHEAVIYRRSDAWRDVILLHNLLLEEGAEIQPCSPFPNRRIDFYGDSILAGGSVEAVGFEGQEDGTITLWNPEDTITNGWWGFGAITARMMDAHAHINGIGGLALLDGTGWYGDPLVGFEQTWDKRNPVPGRMTLYDFAEFQPQVIVCSIGQNCARNGDITDPDHKSRWIEAYCRILEGLRQNCPGAKFLLTTTILRHERAWDEAVRMVANIMEEKWGEGSVQFHAFARMGVGTPGHLRIAEEREMAEELDRAILNLRPEGDWPPL